MNRWLKAYITGFGNFKKSFKNKEDIETYKKIGNITLPAFIELFTMSLFGVINMAMVASLGNAAISGIGITNQPFFLLIAILFGVNVGTTTLVSWEMGKGDKKKASFITRQAVAFNFILGAFLALIGFFGARFFMPIMINDPEIIEISVEYLEIISIGLAINAATMAITAALRGAGETKMPMFYNMSANIINVIFNFLLIEGRFGFPRLETAGAAWATNISRISVFIAAICVIRFWKRSPIKVKFKSNWIPKIQTIKDIFTIGLPAAGEQLVIQTGLLLYTRILTTLPREAFTAHNIAVNVNGMAFSVSQAFSISNTALVGRACGQDDYELAEKYTVFARRLARMSTAVVTVLLIVLSPLIIGIYTDDTIVRDYALPIFFVMAATQYIQSHQMTTAGALRGAGDTMYPLYASIIGIYGFRIALTLLFVFVFRWGIFGGWMAFFMDQMGRSVVIRLRFSSGKWKSMRQVKEQRMRERKEKLMRN